MNSDSLLILRSFADENGFISRESMFSALSATMGDVSSFHPEISEHFPSHGLMVPVASRPAYQPVPTRTPLHRHRNSCYDVVRDQWVVFLWLKGAFPVPMGVLWLAALGGSLQAPVLSFFIKLVGSLPLPSRDSSPREVPCC